MNRRKLSQGVALLMVGGFAAGCSSGVSRFTADDLMTGSISSPNQRQVTQAPAPAQVNDYESAPVGGVVSGGVTRSSLPPVANAAPTVTRSAIAAPRQIDVVETAAVAAPPVVKERAQSAATTTISTAKTRVAESTIDPLSSAVERGAGATNSAASAVKKAAAPVRTATADPAGWSSAGGSQITAKDGETVYNLSRRYGVPADVLMKVNGIDKSGTLQSGQKVTIPTYIYSDRAPVSAPDNNPKVASAKSSRGQRDTDAEVAKYKAFEQQGQPADVAVAKPAAKGTYVVEAGDTLSGIARKNGTTVAALQAANGITDGKVRSGQKLKVPGAGEKVVAAKTVAAAKPSAKPEAKQESQAAAPKIDPVKTASTPAPAKPKVAASAKAEAVAYQPATSKSHAISAVENDSKEAAPTSTGIGKMRWPVAGRVVSGYGKGSGTSRDGIDISVPEGTPVKAAENGVVIYAGDGLKDFGNTVLVRHDNGLVTVYGHANALNVKRGQKVKRGEQLATAGMSGSTTSPKLHFEVRKDSAPVDPAKYLE